MAADTNQPVARRKYYEIMQYKMKRNFFLREAGFVIKPLLFWLGTGQIQNVLWINL